MKQTEEFTLEEILEIVNILLDFSNNAIIKRNFIKNFKNNTVNGRLHGHYHLGGTQSWRLSSSDPNILNLPSSGSVYAKPIKQCFVAEKDHIFCIVDYNALEERVIANLSKDNNKCSIFNDNVDSHCLNSYTYFQEEIEKELPREPNEELIPYIKRYKKAIDDGNKNLKKIRQKSKACSFLLNYGGYPRKLSKYIKCSEKKAKEIFDKYHNELYSGISTFKKQAHFEASKSGRVHLGLGAYLNVDNINRDIRSVFNCLSQYWAILSLITIEKIMSLVKENNLQKDIEVISSIYDSIYFHVTKDPYVIHWLNTNLIPIMVKDFLKDTIVHNEAELEIGLNWADIVAIPNNASVLLIRNKIKEAEELVAKSSN